jgi:lysylphosphatidylglycerol synthetase-like protein (DUF2156 family)
VRDVSAVSTVTEGPVRGPMEKQLNVALMVVMVMALVIVAYGVVYIANNDPDADRSQGSAIQIAVVFLMLPGVVVFFTARSARRRLQLQVVSARLFGILTGVFCVLAGLPILSTVVGLLTLVVGLFTLTAALLLKKERLR